MSGVITDRILIDEYHNSGVDGSVIGNMVTRVGSSVDAYRAETPILNLMVIWIGVNDLRYVNADTAYTNLRNYVEGQVSKGWGVILLTCTPSTYTGLPADFEDRRVAYNNHIKNDFSEEEYVWSFDTDTVSQSLNPDNVTYYPDKLHPSQALHYLIVDSLLNTLDMIAIGIRIGNLTIPSVSAPTVTTTAITSITTSTASSGGNVTADGGAGVTVRGVCWSTSANPTTADSKTTDGSGTGIFTSAITGLSQSTVYHVRAYATNAEGTSYGSDVEFTSAGFILQDTFTDTDATQLNAHTMDIGSGWTAANQWFISTNQLDCNGITGYAVCEAGVANHTVSMDIVMQDSNYYKSGIVFRYQDSTHKWTLFLTKHISLNSGVPRIMLYEDTTLRGEANVTQEEITAKLKVVASGNNISCYWKDMSTALINYTSSTYNDKTKVGIFSEEGAGYIFRPVDNFEVV